MSKVVFDASSIIYAWDEYPIQQFPRLWKWLAEQVEKQEIIFSILAWRETGHKYPDCAKYLTPCQPVLVTPDNAISSKALEIQQSLGIVDDRYGGGVSENDIFIIATAWVRNLPLVNNEAIQQELPTNLKKYKIPAVCAMNDVQVKSFNFRAYFVQSGQVF